MRIPYTIEMQSQDMLYRDKANDPKEMFHLHKLILNNARHQGFRGLSNTTNHGGDILTTIYIDQEHRDDVQRDAVKYITQHATCDDIIKEITHLSTLQSQFDLVYIVDYDDDASQGIFEQKSDAVNFRNKHLKNNHKSIEMSRAFADIDTGEIAELIYDYV